MRIFSYTCISNTFTLIYKYIFTYFIGFIYNGNKVRKANLIIPRVYSHRIQRIARVSTDSICLENNSNSKEIDSYYFPIVGTEKWLCIYKK